jgi:aryl-alcohol dehydrogenase-like predicted oxidoreductase
MSVVGHDGHCPADLAPSVPDRRFGHLDWDVPIAGLGCDNFGVRLDRHQSVSVVHAALDAGVQFFDTARAYGKGRSEEFLGEALKGCREEVRIATKFGTPFEVAGDEVQRVSNGGFASPDIMRASLEASLRALYVDHIDLFQIHHYDPGTPLEDMLLAMDGLVQAGKVLAIGCSNFSIEQVLHVAKLCEGLSIEAIASVQFEWSLVNRDSRRTYGRVPTSWDSACCRTIPWPVGSSLDESVWQGRLLLPVGYAIRGTRASSGRRISTW